jgi:predicted ATPase
VALLAQGAIEEAIVFISQGLTEWDRLGRTFYSPYGLAFLAEGLVRGGQRVTAQETVRKGLEMASATGEHMWDAELHRLKGLLLLAENKLDESQIAFERSLEIARHQQANSLGLRAATSLARMWGEQGRHGEARDLLAPVYGWFTEGFDTGDLKEAKALLDELQ